MKKPSYSDVLCKAEAIAFNPKNRLSNGNLKAPVQKQLEKLTFKVAYLSQFATPKSHYKY